MNGLVAAVVVRAVVVVRAQPQCGAWAFHQAGVPVDKSPQNPKCSANKYCPNNPGADCCPTPDGTMLDCCNIYSCECELHPQCVYEGKTGTCCPNEKGIYDPCCSNYREAVNNPSCVEENITGRVCPTKDGEYLDCCKPLCSYKNQCPGLAGFCCPTPDGIKLGCCGSEVEAEQLMSGAVMDGSGVLFLAGVCGLLATVTGLLAVVYFKRQGSSSLQQPLTA